MRQRVVLPARGTLAGWRKGLTRKLLQFNKGKSKVLHLRRKKPLHG